MEGVCSKGRRSTLATCSHLSAGLLILLSTMGVEHILDGTGMDPWDTKKNTTGNIKLLPAIQWPAALRDVWQLQMSEQPLAVLLPAGIWATAKSLHLLCVCR